MKSNILLITLMAISTFGFSQEIRTLSSNESSKSGFGGPLIQAANINSDWGIIIGGKGGVLINRKFAFGGIGKVLTNSIDFTGDDSNGNNNAPLSMDYAAGGLFFEYLINIESPIHVSFPINFMAGEVLVYNAASEIEVESSGIFVIEPGVNLEFNVSQTLIPSIHLSYRQVFGSSIENMSNQDISGVNIGLMFKFGNF